MMRLFSELVKAIFVQQGIAAGFGLGWARFI
jgi:hypothetical protein